MTALRMVARSPLPGAIDADDDAELIAAARRGSRAAFASLYHRYAPLVHGVLLARADLARSDADDVMQDVFLRAWQRLDGLRDAARLGPWLCRIAHRRAMDSRRAARRAERFQLHLASLAHHDPPSAPTDPPPDTARAEAVLAIIRELPGAYRQTLILRLVEGLTGPEIARHTGLTEGSVRVNLCRGMKLLRNRLPPELAS